MKYCKNCGFPAESDDQEYCTQCGMPFNGSAVKHDESGMSDHRAKEHINDEKPVDPPKPPLHGLIDFVNSKLGKGVLFAACAALLFLTGFLLASRNADAGVISVPTPTPDAAVPTAEPAGDPSPEEVASVPAVLEGLVVPGEQTASPSESLVVLRNALPDGIVTVDGVSVPFSYVGPDAVIDRAYVPDFCIIRIVAPYENGYATAAVCYNCYYGNDMIFGSTVEDGVNNYGAYTTCDISGFAVPNSGKFIDILTWDYFEFYQEAVNYSDINRLKYLTKDCFSQRASDAVSEFGVQYNLADFNVSTDPDSIHIMTNPDGTAYITVNVRFKGNVTADGGMEYASEQFYTLRYVWDSNMWQVGDSVLISADDFKNGAVGASMSN